MSSVCIIYGGNLQCINQKTFGRIFWVDDNDDFKSCPLNVDNTGDFDHEDYVSEWEDWEGVDMKKPLQYSSVQINKTQYSNFNN